jgi:hypothetical protein
MTSRRRAARAGLGLVVAVAGAVVLSPGSVASGAAVPAVSAPAAAPVSAPASAPAGVDDLLRPDLVALPARGLSVHDVDGVRWLRFGSVLGNVGPGPVEIRQNQNRRCPHGEHNATQVMYRDANGDGVYQSRKDTDIARRQAGCMIYHPEHHHWHFQASARYVVLDPRTVPAKVVAAHHKVSFCLRDSERLSVRYGRWDYPDTYGACSARSRQGLSVGWADVYQSYLPGQELALPRRLPDGLYCLKTVVDPLDQLAESDDEDNTSLRAFSLHGLRVHVRPTARCR